MILRFLVILLLATGLASCASKKVGKPQTTFAPATFTIADVTIDNAASPRASRDFMRMMRKAANETRDTYNLISGNDQSIYNLELSLSQVTVDDGPNSVLPITSNVIEMIATLRQPESGMAMRTVPVRYQLVALDSEDTKARQLIRGALPEAFNGVYGQRSTPEVVKNLVGSNALFGEADVAAVQSRPVVRSAPSASAAPSSVSVETQSSGEPTVIGCNIC